MEISRTVVVAAGSRIDEARVVFNGADEAVVEWSTDYDEAGRRLEELFESGGLRVAIFGDDGLTGRVVTAYRRRRRLGSRPLEVWPLDVGATHVADHAGGAVSPSRAARLLDGGVEKWNRTRVGTLKVTASTEPAARYGFSFGVGWVYRALEARKRARGGAGNFVSAVGRLATETLGADEGGEPVAPRTSIDYDPVDDLTGSLVASTLETTPFGPGSGGDGALMWSGLSASQLVRRAVGPGILEGEEVRGRPFESIHLDTPDGWLLDGRLHGAGESGVVQVVPGPTVTVVRPRTGLQALVGGLFD